MKVLILRFSSIGDIVLTTPILRCLKNQIPGIEIHYLVKSKFKIILENNPNISKIHCFEKSTKEVTKILKLENYDYVIDLHSNIRTLVLKLKLNKKSYAFPKLNFKKWLLVNFKKNTMPDLHIVNRYFQAVAFLNIKNDLQNGDYFISESEKLNIELLFGFKEYIAIAIGAQFATKRLPLTKLNAIIEKLDQNIILLGDKTDDLVAQKISEAFPNKIIKNACGKFSLNQSASIVKNAKVLLTHDTGLMHIASCFNIPIVSIWGNTVPELGMFPYMPEKKENFTIHQVQNLQCRPCSKIGFKSCPKKHFSCMNLQDEKAIAEDVLSKFSLS